RRIRARFAAISPAAAALPAPSAPAPPPPSPPSASPPGREQDPLQSEQMTSFYGYLAVSFYISNGDKDCRSILAAPTLLAGLRPNISTALHASAARLELGKGM